MSTALTINPLRKGDLTSVVSIEKSVYATPWNIEHFAEIVDLPCGLGLIACVDPGEVIGYAVGWVAADEAELANIAVVAEQRGQGVGGRLLREISVTARSRGADRMYLEVRRSNRDAQRFYANHGFDRVGRRSGYYSGPREDAVVMAVDLVKREG
ncbi:MAG: ribosomal protein S18-alanine N-acetyltransferase [Gemmatimonadetes bacterium]|nr:ribosomal protein S18-alanine N-acetyltransferase [Gemmatimonadota bacterium]